MAKFKVGDLCRIVYLEPDSDEKFKLYKGEIVEVIDFSEAGFEFHNQRLKYEVKALTDGEEFYCTEYELKLIEPPRRDIDQVVSWETVGWKPRELEKA
jgi:hypothetical protein